jgi:hypothetical protein
MDPDLRGVTGHWERLPMKKKISKGAGFEGRAR